MDGTAEQELRQVMPGHHELERRITRAASPQLIGLRESGDHPDRPLKIESLRARPGNRVVPRVCHETLACVIPQNPKNAVRKSRIRHNDSDLKIFVTTTRPSAPDRRDVRTNAVADPRAGRLHRFVGQMRIASSGLNLRVTKKLADHGQALAEGQGWT